MLFIGITLSPLASGFADAAPDRGPSDVELYRAEISRIHAGASYYAAADAELTGRGYFTRSVFNWRTPLLGTALGALPNPAWGQAALGLLAAGVLFAACHLLMKKGALRRGLLCGAMLVGGTLPCYLPNLYVMHEVWAGALIAASVLAYGLRRPAWGVAAGAAALFVRELAAPYCLLCLLMAIAGRRWREAHRLVGSDARLCSGLCGTYSARAAKNYARRRSWPQLAELWRSGIRDLDRPNERVLAAVAAMACRDISHTGRTRVRRGTLRLGSSSGARRRRLSDCFLDRRAALQPILGLAVGAAVMHRRECGSSGAQAIGSRSLADDGPAVGGGDCLNKLEFINDSPETTSNSSSFAGGRRFRLIRWGPAFPPHSLGAGVSASTTCRTERSCLWRIESLARGSNLIE